jgi:hypothetical protein
VEESPHSGLQVLYQKQTEWSDWTTLLTAVKSRHDITALHIPRSHRRRSEGCYLSNFRVQEFALGDANGSIHIWEENGRMLWSGTVANGLAITSITSFCTIIGNRMYLAAFSNKSETGMLSTRILGIEIEKGSRKATIYNIVQTYDEGFNIPVLETQATLKTLYAWCPKAHRRRSQVVSIAGITTDGVDIFGQLRIETAHSEDSNDITYTIDWFYKRFGRFDQYGAAIAIGIQRDHPAGRVYVLTSLGYVGTILPRHYLGGSKTMSCAHIHLTHCPFEGGKNVTIVQSKFDRNHLSFATLSDAGRLQVARLFPRGRSCTCVVPVDEYAGLQRSMSVVAGYVLTVNNSGTVSMYNGSTGLSVVKETTLVKLENAIPRSEKKNIFQFVPWFPPWPCAQKDLKVSRACLDSTGHLKEGDVLETADVLDDAQLLKSTGLILVRPSPNIVAIYSTWLPPYNLPRHHPRAPVDRHRHDTQQGRSPQFHILTQLNWVGLLHPILIAVVVAVALRRNRIAKQETDLMLKGKHRWMVAPSQPERSSCRWEGISRDEQDSSDSEAEGRVPALESQSRTPSYTSHSTFYNQPRESEAETFQRWKDDTFRSERRLKDRGVVRPFPPRENYARLETQAGQDDTIETIPLAQQLAIDRAPIQTKRAPRLIWD